jgi:hypothetical protein
MMDVVLAYYNNTEFEEFLKTYSENIQSDYSIYLYDKSNEYRKQMTKGNVIPCLNVGREGETYLNHIITHYDKLNEYTLFIQDDTEQHIMNYVHFVQQCNDVVANHLKFKLFATSWRKGGRPHIREIIDGHYTLHTLTSPDCIKQACILNNIYLPHRYITETCAFFVCHRDRIRERPKDFYIRLRSWLLEKDTNGFILEHIWKLIFMDA